MRPRAVFVRAGILCLIAGCIALLPVSAHADLELRLSSDKSTYIQDEPLFHARVTVRNTGAEAAKVLKLLEPRFGFIRFEIEYPGGEILPYEPQAQASIILSSAHWIPIPSGGEYSARIDISKHAVEPGSTRNTLYRPGEYRLRAYLDAPASKDDSKSRLKLVSNDLRITVQKPQGIDRKAHSILTEELRDGRMWTSLRSDGRDKYYRRVIAEYPESRYTPYARYWLALYDARIGTPVLGSGEVATLQKSCERFELLADEAGNTPLGLSLLRCAIRARAILGEADKARLLLDRALAMPFLSSACRETLEGYHSAIDARWGHMISPGAGDDADN